MVLYFCERCGYETKRKSNFKNHLNRKKICPPLLEDIDIKNIKIKYGFEKPDDDFAYFGKKNTKNHKKLSKIKQKREHKKNTKRTFLSKIKQNREHKKNTKRTFLSKKEASEGVLDFSEDEILDVSKNGSVILCKFCNRVFNSKTSKYRHQKYHCKFKKNEKELALESEIQKLKNEIKKIKNESVKTVQNIHNQQNITNNNITINNYKYENIDYITNKVLEKLITNSPYNSISRLTRCIHFNTKHPENHNLAITNLRSKFARVRKNDIWQVKFLNELLEELITTKFNIIDEYYEFSGIKDKIHDWKAANYEKYRDEILEDTKIRDRIKKRLFESIINFTKELELKCT